MALKSVLAAALLACTVGSSAALAQQPAQAQTGLWSVYEQSLRGAKHIDLTHAFAPVQPVWPGFGQAEFKATTAGADIPNYVKKGEEYTYAKHGFVATSYALPTDQYGTQLDPPAHWDEYGATISDLPPTYAIRPLVVIPIQEKVAADPGYHLSLQDVKDWESRNGRIPEGAVVMVRSDWYKGWNDPARFASKPHPGVSLDALKFLHLERKILFHGHEPLDTDTTPTLEGESWLLHNHFTQAEGVANLDKVPETGGLISIGFAKPLGGTGGYARYVAIAPVDFGPTALQSQRLLALPSRSKPLPCAATRRACCALNLEANKGYYLMSRCRVAHLAPEVRRDGSAGCRVVNSHHNQGFSSSLRTGRPACTTADELSPNWEVPALT